MRLEHDDTLLIAASLQMALRLANEKVTRISDLVVTTQALNDAALHLQAGNINGSDVEVISACLESTRRLIRSDRNVSPSQRAAVCAQCERIVEMMQRELKGAKS